MKRVLLIIYLFISQTGIHAQFITGTPPAIEWSKTDIWPTESFYYTPPQVAVPAEKSGEDWFYNVKVRHDLSTKEPTGYVAGGYISDPALYNFHVSDLNALGGCGTEFMNTGCEDLRLSDVSGLPGYDIIVPGVFMPAITLMDLNGNHSPSDYKRFETHGEFKGAFPTSDGGYLGYGYTFYSSKLNFSGGAIVGISPIYYNPAIGQPLVSFETADNGGNMINFPWLFGKALIVKYNSNLGVEWYYTYGSKNYVAGPGNPAYSMGTEATYAMECDGGYIIGGGDNTIGAWFKKIDYNGNILWSNQLAGGNITHMARTIENGNETFYMSGSYDFSSVYLSKVSATGTELWTIVEDPSPTISTHDIVCGLEIANDGNIYIGGVADLVGGKGTGYIYKFNFETGSTIHSFIEPFECVAQDLRYSITATSDGGCAVVGTIIKDPVECIFSVPQNYIGTPTITCTPGFEIWNSDAYVAKFDSALTKIWSTTFDAPTETPGGTALDILSDCATCGGSCPLNSWEIPNQLGLDVTRRECMFGITEAPDRSIVVVGKNARNLDDSYIVKLECEAEYSPLVLAGLTIDNTRKYKAGAIETRTDFLATNTSRITMEACKYILFDEVTTISSGSVTSATVASYNCCNSGGPSGMRVAAANGVELNQENPFADKTNDIEINIFPNPNSGAFSITIEVYTDQLISLEILDGIGNTVIAKKDYLIREQLNTEMNLGNYKKGIYIAKIGSSTKMILKKIIIE